MHKRSYKALIQKTSGGATGFYKDIGSLIVDNLSYYFGEMNGYTPEAFARVSEEFANSVLRELRDRYGKDLDYAFKEDY